MPHIPLHMLRNYVRKNVGGNNCMAITSEKRFGLVDIQHMVMDSKRRHRNEFWEVFYYDVKVV
jgi:hypothetical protein